MSQPRKSSRRKFLTGGAAVEALGDLTHGTADDNVKFSRPPTTASAATYLVELSRHAMACEFQIFLTAAHQPHEPDAGVAALDLIDRLEDQLSVYRDDSEISQLNRQAAFHDVSVEPRFFELLKYSLWLHNETNGAFDITSGPLTKAWGFYERKGKVPDADALADALSRMGSQFLTLDEQQQTIRFAKENLEINLGGIGKGYALDRAAELLLNDRVEHFLFHGGRSSVLARGSRIPAAAEENPWQVGVGHPLRPEKRLGLLRLGNRAMSTSGSATQSFHHQGQRYGHVLDPRTGRPATGVLTTVAVAPRAATADALSTAFYVLGVEGTESFCRRHREIAAIVVCPSGRGGSLDMHAFNFEGGDWMPA